VCGVITYNNCSKCSLSVLTQAHNRFALLLLVYCTVDNTPLHGSQPRNSLFGFVHVKSLLLLWKLRSWFWANLKTFYCINSQLSRPKTICTKNNNSKCCELVKLCHPAVRFFKDTVYYIPVFRCVILEYTLLITSHARDPFRKWKSIREIESKSRFRFIATPHNK